MRVRFPPAPPHSACSSVSQNTRPIIERSRVRFPPCRPVWFRDVIRKCEPWSAKPAVRGSVTHWRLRSSLSVSRGGYDIGCVKRGANAWPYQRAVGSSPAPSAASCFGLLESMRIVVCAAAWNAVLPCTSGRSRFDSGTLRSVVCFMHGSVIQRQG